MIDRLSARQRQCLRLVSEGFSSKEIARELGVSPSTVDNHISGAMQMLGIDDRRQAARLYLFCQVDNIGPSAIEADAAPMALLEMPPIGGTENLIPIRRRALHVFQIGLIGMMTVCAIMIVISGMVQLFAK